jgi:hypothetical protein
MIPFLRSLWLCRWKKQHDFGRGKDDAEGRRFKKCKLCPAEVHVKRRIRKGPL